MTIGQIVANPFRKAYDAFSEAINFDGDQNRDVRFVPFLTWMTDYRRALAVGKPFDLTEHRYLEEIYADDCLEMVLCKAGQVGVSELLLSWIIWSADIRRATGLYVFPTDTHVSDFSAARLGPAIEPEVSPYLAGLIRSGMDKTYRGADRVGLKRIRDRFIYFRGAKVQPDGKAAQLRSIDADVLVLDEFDEMDRRAPAIAVERLRHSRIRQVRKASTPTYAGVGIHAEYMKSDQRRWFVRCTACGEFQDLTLSDLIVEWDALERPTAWHQNENGEPFLACRKCGGEMDRTGPGEWVSTYLDREIHGYHLSRLFSAQSPLREIITGLGAIEEIKRQQVYNQGLGLPYRPRTSVSLTDDILNGCRREYLVPNAAEIKGRVYCGIDVGSVLHVVIREKRGDGSRQVRFIGEVSDFNEAARLMEEYKVTVAVIDALPETKSVRAFQSKYVFGKIWVAYYPGHNAAVTKMEDVADWDENETKVSIDRTRSIDTTFAGFILASEGKAGNTLPANAADLPDYYEQMKAPERRLVDAADGNKIAVYIESGPDHFAHAENYCYVASLCPMAPVEGNIFI